jgi:uncharacterized protein YjiS (DUF1127 family)
MTAQFAKDQVSFFPAATMSVGAPAVYAPATGSPLGAPFRAVARWLTSTFHRRAVISELNMLTDRELADIGLMRSEIPHVFERSFAVTRVTPNAADA